jgi:hypothetical protein
MLAARCASYYIKPDFSPNQAAPQRFFSRKLQPLSLSRVMHGSFFAVEPQNTPAQPKNLQLRTQFGFKLGTFAQIPIFSRTHKHKPGQHLRPASSFASEPIRQFTF